MAVAAETSPKQVFQISTNIWKNCPECSNMPHSAIGDDEIDERVNHVLQHGYKLLHVGQQTSEDSQGRIWQTTVAILGR
jgi:hypothetical protein